MSEWANERINEIHAARRFQKGVVTCHASLHPRTQPNVSPSLIDDFEGFADGL